MLSRVVPDLPLRATSSNPLSIGFDFIWVSRRFQSRPSNFTVFSGRLKIGPTVSIDYSIGKKRDSRGPSKTRFLCHVFKKPDILYRRGQRIAQRMGAGMGGSLAASILVPPLILLSYTLYKNRGPLL